MTNKPTNEYPKLKYTTDKLSAFFIYDDYCILSIKGGEERTLIFVPDDIKAFEQWLEAHKVRRVRVSEL